jgi:hypothetical protein
MGHPARRTIAFVPDPGRLLVAQLQLPLWPAPPPRETIRDRFEGAGPAAREAVAEVVR